MKKYPFSLALLKAFHAQNNVFRPMIAEVGLSVGQPKIMDFLTPHDGCMQKDLAAMCDIEPATISRLLDKMEADGLITRSAVEGNKRAAAISLTAEGHRRQETVVGIRAQLEARELAGFSDEERALFFEFLNRLYHNLTNDGGGDGK